MNQIHQEYTMERRPESLPLRGSFRLMTAREPYFRKKTNNQRI